MIQKEEIFQALNNCYDPCCKESKISVVDMGLIEEIHIDDGDGSVRIDMLLTSGWNDARVDPWMPGKMAARLQQANPEGGPYLMRVEFEAGHGGVARSAIWEEIADEYTFLLWALQSD